MNPTRKIAVITGVLFILATLAGPLLATPLTPDLTGTDYLAGVSAHMNQAAGGVLLWIIAAFASAGIAIAMYPVLKERNVGLALGSVVFRALEAGFYMVGLVCLLSLLTLGQQFRTAGAADRAVLQAIGDSLVSVREYAGLLAVFAFCVGAFMYYYPALPVTAHSPLAVGLRDRCDHPDADGLRVGPVQRQPYYQLHSAGGSDLRTGNRPGGLADRQGLQSSGGCRSVCQAVIIGGLR